MLLSNGVFPAPVCVCVCARARGCLYFFSQAPVAKILRRDTGLLAGSNSQMPRVSSVRVSFFSRLVCDLLITKFNENSCLSICIYPTASQTLYQSTFMFCTAATGVSVFCFTSYQK